MRQASEQNSFPGSAWHEQLGCAHVFGVTVSTGIVSLPFVTSPVVLSWTVLWQRSGSELGQNHKCTPIPIHSTLWLYNCPFGEGPEKYSART